VFNIQEHLKILDDLQVDIHSQIVVIPDWNDKIELENTLKHLTAMNSVQTVGIVPVGITKYRKGLVDLRLLEKEEASEIIELADRYNAKEKFNRVFCSDELYIKSEKIIPEEDYYEGYQQIENGIGMIRYATEAFKQYENEFIKEIEAISGQIYFVTAVSASVFIKEIVQSINHKLGYKKCDFVVIKNRYLGETVTVAGLISASDLFQQLAFNENYTLVLPSSMFNADSLTLDQVSMQSIGGHYKSDLIIMNELFESWRIIRFEKEDHI